MPVESNHPDYERMLPIWQKLRDLADGDEETLKKPGRRHVYLPPLSGHKLDAAAYDDFVNNNHLFNGLSRVLDLVVGLLFRKPGTFKWPRALEEFLKDVTGLEESFEQFGQELAREAFLMSRTGVLTEYPMRLQAGYVTVHDAEEQGLRPYWVRYDAEAIVNWSYERVGARKRLRMVTLLEEASAPGGDIFEPKTVPQRRVLDLDGAGYYRQRVYQEQKGENGRKSWQQVGSPIYPQVPNGTGSRMLRRIPFRIFGPPRKIRTPSLNSLGNAVCAHWRTSALYYSALRKVAIPQFYTAGELVGADQAPALVDLLVERRLLPENLDPEAVLKALTERPIRLGVDYALQFADPQGKAAYAEFTGQGIGAIRLALRDLQEEMVVQGARILAPDKLAPETATAEKIRRGESNSVLSRFAHLHSAQLRGPVLDVLEYLARPADGFEIALNTDFFDEQLTGKEVLEYVSAHMRGGIPGEDLFHILKRGEVLRPELTYQDYKRAIAADQLDSPMGALLPDDSEVSDEDLDDELVE